MESGHVLVIVRSLILISAANGAPVLFARLLGTRFARPIDGGIVLRDGHPLLGRSKTWRGLAAAVVFTACAAVLISLPWQAGALAGASAVAGDCLSSFVKRRFGLEPSSMTLGLDQVPESLFPAVACSVYLPLVRAT
jgi:CDP-diglyceride synthetase